MTNLEKGDLDCGGRHADESGRGHRTPTREVFYNLGEVKFAKGQTDEAAKWYQKAVGHGSHLGQAALQARRWCS